MLESDVAIYKQLLELQNTEFKQIQHNDSIVAVVYKVIMPGGLNYILKICDQEQHFQKELYFLNYLAGKLPVPKVIATIEPQPNLYGAILMECLPGDILQAKDLTPSLAFELGALLANIHLNRTSEFGDLTQPDSKMQDPRIYFAAKFEESFAECISHLSADLLQKCRGYYEQNIDCLLAVDGPCIIHRDFRPGNIMVQDNKVAGIIDWASGRSGFAEDDLCPLEIGEWGHDPEIKQDFLNGYSSVRNLPDCSEIMPLLLLNRAIAAIGFTIKIGTYNNRDAELYNRNLDIMKKLLN